MKREIYNFIVRMGLKFLGKLFPGIHMSVPLKPSDRYLEYPFICKNLSPDKNIKILDIGSAGSYFPLLVASLGYEVTACDLRPYEILNNLEFNNFKFIQQDICRDRLPKESFDVVTCISVLEHIGIGGRYGALEDKDGDIKMIHEINRLLKVGGRALITVPYGIAEIFPPYQRIYDLTGIRKITSAFKVEEEIYYSRDKKGEWKESCAEEGQLVRGSPDKYGLALLCLKKI